MKILVLNCGSSSVKFQIIDTDLERIKQDADRCLVHGVVERVGSHALITYQVEGKPPVRLDAPLRDHRSAIDAILRWIVSAESEIEAIRSMSDLHAVGHRVVHGGEKFKVSVRIDGEVLAGIEDCIDLAPLHNPANLKGIRAAEELLGSGVPQVAVFDTAFHSTMPEVSFLYGIPYQHYRRHKIRRYGFHVTSHRYVAYRYRTMLGLPRDEVRIITLHLGNGCSACAIREGDSYDTSMGFTPLEGLLMATRSGDVDASILEYLSHKEGLTLQEIDSMLNKQSGLLGLSGLTADMRDLLEEEAENEDRRARLAIEIFCQRVRKYIGAYFVALGGARAAVFTGGIGENSPIVRRRICQGLDSIGLHLDAGRNDTILGGQSGEISTEDSACRAYVIPTNEELLIARDTYRVIHDAPRRW
jgi:acetate kinase